MRLIKQVILGLILIGIAVMAVANRNDVTLHLVPEPLEALLPIENSYTLPLYVVLISFIVVGLLLGYLFEYLRERKHRRTATRGERQISKLENEVAKLKSKSGEHDDDVLALLN